MLLFVCVGVVYSGEYDVCGVTLSVHDHGGNRKVLQKCNSSKYLSAFLQAIRHQSRHPG